jgi:hypothetical protein
MVLSGFEVLEILSHKTHVAYLVLFHLLLFGACAVLATRARIASVESPLKNNRYLILFVVGLALFKHLLIIPLFILIVFSAVTIRVRILLLKPL